MEELKLIIEALGSVGAAAQPLFYTWIFYKMFKALAVILVLFYFVRCGYFIANQALHNEETRKHAQEAARLDSAANRIRLLTDRLHVCVKENKTTVEMLKNMNNPVRNRIIQDRVDATLDGKD